MSWLIVTFPVVIGDRIPGASSRPRRARPAPRRAAHRTWRPGRRTRPWTSGRVAPARGAARCVRRPDPRRARPSGRRRRWMRRRHGHVGGVVVGEDGGQQRGHFRGLGELRRDRGVVEDEPASRRLDRVRLCRDARPRCYRPPPGRRAGPLAGRGRRAAASVALVGVQPSRNRGGVETEQREDLGEGGDLAGGDDPVCAGDATSWSAIAARCSPSSASIRFFSPVSFTPAATSHRRCAVRRRRSAVASPSPDSRCPTRCAISSSGPSSAAPTATARCSSVVAEVYSRSRSPGACPAPRGTAPPAPR